MKRTNNFLIITDLMDMINFTILFSCFFRQDPFISAGTMEEFSPADNGKWKTIDAVKSPFTSVQAIAF